MTLSTGYRCPSAIPILPQCNVAQQPVPCGSSIYRGYPKLFGNTERFVGSFQAIGLPGYSVYVAGVVESSGGLAIAPRLFISKLSNVNPA